MHHDWRVKKSFCQFVNPVGGKFEPNSINVLLIESVGASEQGCWRFFAVCDANLTSHIAADLFKVRSLLKTILHAWLSCRILDTVFF